MRPATIAQIVFILLAAFVVFNFVRAAQSDQRQTSCTALCSLAPQYAGRDRRAPDFELVSASGKKVKLSSFRGKTVFLNFWTPSCRPCLEEMPSVAELAKVAKTRDDMVVVTVAAGTTPQEAEDTLKVAVGGDLPFEVLFDPESDIVLGKYGTKLFPETWIIDPNGIIRARFDGARDWADSLATNVVEMVSRPGGCPVEFAKGQPRGKFAGLCGDEG